jgi:hypothetical protein
MKLVYSIALIFITAIGSIPTYGQTATDSTVDTTDTTPVSSVLQAQNSIQPPKSADTAHHLYRMNYLASGAFCIVASAADVYAIPKVIKSKIDITGPELAAANTHVFTGLDHIALEQDPSKRDFYAKASDYSLPVLIALPALLAFDKNIKKDWFRILLMYYEMHAITFSIYNYSFLGPAFQNKYRPLVYYGQLSSDEKKGGNNRNSMYSGHTATAIASTYFMVKVYSDYHPEIGSKKYLLYAIATVPPLIEGYFRVKAMVHFPSDVLVGMTIGAACGILVPEIHRFKDHRVILGVSSTPFGPGLNMVYNMK